MLERLKAFPMHRNLQIDVTKINLSQELWNQFSVYTFRHQKEYIRWSAHPESNRLANPKVKCEPLLKTKLYRIQPGSHV